MKNLLSLLMIASLLLTACETKVENESTEFRPTMRDILQLLPGLYSTETANSYESYCTWRTTDKTSILVDNYVRTLCLWVFKSDFQNKITHLLVYYDRWNPTLPDLVDRYGAPDAVMWSDRALDRYVIWSNQGVLALVFYKENIRHSKAIFIVYFEPMTLKNFQTQYPNWPWASAKSFISEENIHAPGVGGRDSLPQDPFDWNALTPTPPNN